MKGYAMAVEHEGFSAEERAAMKERAKELKVAATKAEGLKAALDSIAEMPAADRAIGKRIHDLVTAAAPHLEAKTWYGQPAYAKDGQVVVFFQAASKFKVRYCTLGFNEAAQLDDGTMWPVAFAVKSLSAADEKRITELVTKAAG